MAKILICGHLGNMGRRYEAIVKHLGHEVIGKDLEDQVGVQRFDKVIVATPTENHLEHCEELAEYNIPFLCEKPVSKDPKEIDKLMGKQGYMVNNWAFVFPGIRLLPGNNNIEYDFYNTGKDGVEWDCIQTIYLANKISIKTDSPVFKCSINGQKISLDQIGQSYVHMVRAFIDGRTNELWTMEQAKEATLKVIASKEFLKNHDISTSTHKQQALSE